VLFFNLETLERQAAGEPYKLLALLMYHFTGDVPRNSRTKYKPSPVSLKGHSFISNPAPVFTLKNIDIAYIVQYIKLCARRDYTNYKLYKQTTLDLSFFPDIDLDKIKTNPLLEIEGNQIKFKYE